MYRQRSECEISPPKRILTNSIVICKYIIKEQNKPLHDLSTKQVLADQYSQAHMDLHKRSRELPHSIQRLQPCLPVSFAGENKISVQ